MLADKKSFHINPVFTMMWKYNAFQLMTEDDFI